MARKKVTLARVRTAQELAAEKQREETARQAQADRARAEEAAVRQRLQLEPQREGRAIADAALRKFGHLGDRRSEGPTAERLLRSGGGAHVEYTAELVEIEPGVEVEVTMARVRVETDHFERMAAAGMLDREPARNAFLGMAGRAYREAWQCAGGSSLRGVNFDMRVDGGKGAGLFASESAASSLQRFRSMRAAVAPIYLPYLDGVTLDGRDLLDVGRQYSGYAGKAQATAVASMLFRHALESVAIVLRLLPRRDPHLLPGQLEEMQRQGLKPAPHQLATESGWNIAAE